MKPCIQELLSFCQGVHFAAFTNHLQARVFVHELTSKTSHPYAPGAQIPAVLSHGVDVQSGSTTSFALLLGASEDKHGNGHL